jgi:hypothetical protein
VTLEDFVVLGARVGVNNHVTISEGTTCRDIDRRSGMCQRERGMAERQQSR